MIWLKAQPCAALPTLISPNWTIVKIAILTLKNWVVDGTILFTVPARNVDEENGII